MNVVSPPPDELVSLCEAMDTAAGLILKDLCEPYPDLGRYEADDEARVLFFGLLRHFEALLECARSDLVLLPAAFTIARSALEQGVKIRWMLKPTDAWDREDRFLAHLADEERMWARCARETDSEDLRPRVAAIKLFREGVALKLPPAVARVERIPSFDKMLEEIGERPRYLAYTILSQYTHGSHYAGSVYRRNLGTEKVFGEWATAQEWALPLQVAWWSLVNAGQAIEIACARREFRSVDWAAVNEINDRLSRLRGVDE